MRGRKNERIFSAREKKSEKLRAVIAGEKKTGVAKVEEEEKRERDFIHPSFFKPKSFIFRFEVLLKTKFFFAGEKE